MSQSIAFACSTLRPRAAQQKALWRNSYLHKKLAGLTGQLVTTATICQYSTLVV